MKNSTGKQWIADEFSGMDLGDERLDKRQGYRSYAYIVDLTKK